jgi:DEAD/DEAH box helicase domain-containing protein
LDKAGAVRVLDVVLDELTGAPELTPEEAEVTRRPAPRPGLFATTSPPGSGPAPAADAPAPDPDDLVF